MDQVVLESLQELRGMDEEGNPLYDAAHDRVVVELARLKCRDTTIDGFHVDMINVTIPFLFPSVSSLFFPLCCHNTHTIALLALACISCLHDRAIRHIGMSRCILSKRQILANRQKEHC